MQYATIVFTLFLFTHSVSADEGISAEHGKSLHDESCVGCHINMTGGDGSTLYTRSNRKIKSRDSLETQIQRCATNTNQSWFENDVKSVAEYLDQKWYQFSQ